MASSPAFAATINRGGCALSATADVAVATAGALITPTGSSFTTLLTAGSGGTKVEEVVIVATGTTTLATVRLYIYTGSAYQLRDVYLIPAYTNSTTAPPTPVVTTYTNLELKSGETLVVSCTVASLPLNALATGGDL